jgi:hypothetical protein
MEMGHKKDTKRTQTYVLLHPVWFPPIPNKLFGMNGGDDGARTRDLCRDSLAVSGFSTTYKPVGNA